MGITPFFVENVSELQLCAIKLVTAVSFQFNPYSTTLFVMSLDVERSAINNQHFIPSPGFFTL